MADIKPKVRFRPIADVRDSAHSRAVSEQSYFRCRWLHNSPAEPVDLWSAIDAQGYEVRKIEIWSDGRVGYATDGEEFGGTALGVVPVPSLGQIAADPEFEPEAISKEVFEAEWRRRVPV